MRPSILTEAKRVIADDLAVPYGVFGLVATTPYFPPHSLLNEFFALGCDPCDQDNRMKDWTPFALTADEYEQIKQWWLMRYPRATEDSLGVSSWSDWTAEILDR